MDRDQILSLSDAELSALVKLEFSCGSGPGGQKRNKTATAVRVVLPEYGIAASDCTERSQTRNRAAALRKLRLELALRERRPPLAPERVRCALESADYPLFAARLLDALAAADFDHRRTAEEWHVSASALIKLLYRDPLLWKWINERRNEAGLYPLNAPR